MNRGKILKVRPGHDANCSAISYIGHVLVSYAGYGVFLSVLVVVQGALQASRLAAKPWIGRLRIASWVIPHLMAMPILWLWASNEGVTNYGSVVCIGALELALLISLVVGWAKIARPLRTEQPTQKATCSCPGCSGEVTTSAVFCPFCGFDLVRDAAP